MPQLPSGGVAAVGGSSGVWTGDAEAVAELMCQLRDEKRFRVDHDVFAQARELLSGDFVTNDESLETIRRMWDEYGYLTDPHTAVSWEVAERLRGGELVLVVSTAQWAKFGGRVPRDGGRGVRGGAA